MLLHDTQEFDNNLRARSDEALALAGLLGIIDRLEAVIENGCLDHFGGIEVWDCSVEMGMRFSSREART